MKKIEMTQSVKHGGRYYSREDRITVEDGLADYFCHCGWAKCLDGEAPPPVAPPKNVTLEVQNGKIGHKASTVGE